jgi:hypothetical protein
MIRIERVVISSLSLLGIDYRDDDVPTFFHAVCEALYPVLQFAPA